MENKAEFHAYLLKAVAVLFALPIILLLVLLKVGANERLSFLSAIGGFVGILIFISLKTVRLYDTKSNPRKTTKRE